MATNLCSPFLVPGILEITWSMDSRSTAHDYFMLFHTIHRHRGKSMLTMHHVQNYEPGSMSCGEWSVARTILLPCHLPTVPCLCHVLVVSSCNMKIVALQFTHLTAFIRFCHSILSRKTLRYRNLPTQICVWNSISRGAISSLGIHMMMMATRRPLQASRYVHLTQMTWLF